MEKEGRSGEAHDPEVGRRVNLSDGVLEMVDWGVHDVSRSMVVGVDHPARAD
jgi:hypothetical protein